MSIDVEAREAVSEFAKRPGGISALIRAVADAVEPDAPKQTDMFVATVPFEDSDHPALVAERQRRDAERLAKPEEA